MSEKAQYDLLPSSRPEAVTTAPQPPRRKWKLYPAAFLLFSALVWLNAPSLRGCHGDDHHDHHRKYTAAEIASAKCPVQPRALQQGPYWNPADDPTYSALAARRLSKAVQIDTVSFDDLPMNASDPAFDKHDAFAHFMENEYAKLFSEPIKHEVVNHHGHLFTWEGSNPALKPILLMAHIDTVPVLAATRDQWTYPPFEGTITVNGTKDTPGTWIWGRGSSDCKNSLLGIYGAVERLVTEGYKPERTILIANGFDEEIGGYRGAGKLAEFIEARYGKDSVSFLLDEGFSGISHEYGSTVASFGMAEKGAMDIEIRVENPGGHSSVPPAHTGIGILSLLLSELERKPFKPELDPRGPYLKYLNCLSDYAPKFPKWLKNKVKNPKAWHKLAKELAKEDRKANSFLATTQAIDLINGGVKINALPEVVTAQINYRISFTSSVNETISHIEHVLRPAIHKLNYTSSLFGEKPKAVSAKHITLTTMREPFEPAPITSTSDDSFVFLAGTTKAVFGEDTVVTPTGMFANTDTHHFWSLTGNLYRFTPALVNENLNQHTVDERISLEGHLDTTRFYYQLIQNANGWKSA